MSSWMHIWFPLIKTIYYKQAHNVQIKTRSEDKNTYKNPK